MITLVTGTPGAGKTLYTVARLLAELQAHLRPDGSVREVYVDGIPGLRVDGCYPVPEGRSVSSYHEWLPDGTALVVDEAQRVFPARGSASRDSAAVVAMQTHRHHGHDLVMVTQHPRLLDRGVRALVGRHLHVRRVWGLRRCVVYQWDACSDSLKLKDAVTSSWRYDSSAWSRYRSAVEVTASPHRVPVIAWVAVAAVVGVPVVGWFAYSRLASRVAPVEVAPAGPAKVGRGSDVSPVHAGGDVAPAQVVPVISGCWSMGDRCVCHDADGWRVPTTDAQCAAVVSRVRPVGAVVGTLRRVVDVSVSPTVLPAPAAPAAREPGERGAGVGVGG